MGFGQGAVGCTIQYFLLVEVVGDGIGRFVIGNGLTGGDGMVGVSLGSE